MARGGGELTPGKVLGKRYRVVRALGRGGMGAVYEAVQEDLGRRVAVKVLHRLLAADSAQLARFRREAEAAAALGHPNIVQVTDFGMEDGLAYLVMELVEGSTLHQLVCDIGPLDPARAAGIGVQVLSALSAVHAAGIVHRDLKPSNVMITRVADLHDHARLLDFGIAKMTEGPGYAKLTATGALVGTPTYMSPEQVSGRPVDGRTDLYALGAVLYTVLCGRRPIDVGPMGAELQRVLTVDPEPLRSRRPDIDPALEAVVMRALRKRPEDRWATAADMAAALRPFASGNGVSQPPPDEPPPAGHTAATVGARPGHVPAVRQPTAATAAERPPVQPPRAPLPPTVPARGGSDPGQAQGPTTALAGGTGLPAPQQEAGGAAPRPVPWSPGQPVSGPVVPAGSPANAVAVRGSAPVGDFGAPPTGKARRGRWIVRIGCLAVFAVLAIGAATALWPVARGWIEIWRGLTPPSEPKVTKVECDDCTTEYQAWEASARSGIEACYAQGLNPPGVHGTDKYSVSAGGQHFDAARTFAGQELSTGLCSLEDGAMPPPCQCVLDALVPMPTTSPFSMEIQF